MLANLIGKRFNVQGMRVIVADEAHLRVALHLLHSFRDGVGNRGRRRGGILRIKREDEDTVKTVLVVNRFKNFDLRRIAVTHADKHIGINGLFLQTLTQLIGDAIGVDLQRRTLFHPNLRITRGGLGTAARQNDQI